MICRRRAGSRPVGLRHRLLALGLAVAGLLGLALLLAPSASAHATVVGSTPVDGSRLSSVPGVVTVDFDQAVSIGSDLGYLHVIDQAGRRVDAGTADHPSGDSSKVSVSLESGLGDGTYTASFRIISADSHPIAGAIRFVVGNGSFAAATVSASAVNQATGTLFDVVRAVAFGGLALLGGGWLIFGTWPQGRDDRRARGLIWTGWWASVLGALAELLVQGPYAAGVGPSSVFNTGLIDATLHTQFGLAHALRLIALGVLGAVIGTLLRRVEPARARLEQVGGLLVVGVALSFAASGHATSEHPRWLATLSDTLHLLAMATWVGGLAVLLIAVLPRREPAELRTVLPRFSIVAYLSVATLAVTGGYQAVLGLGSWRAVVATDYGRLILAKVALFVVLLGLGNLSRTVVQRRWVRRQVAHAMTDTVADQLGGSRPEQAGEPDPTGQVRVLRRAVLAELVVAVAVLGVTAVLVAEPPGPAALDTLDARPQTVHASLGNGRTVDLTLSSRRHGSLSIDIGLSSGPAPLQLTATAALPAKELGPITIPLTTQAGSYHASSVLFPSAGRWTVTVTVRTSEFDSTVSGIPVSLT